MKYSFILLALLLTACRNDEGEGMHCNVTIITAKSVERDGGSFDAPHSTFYRETKSSECVAPSKHGAQPSHLIY